jgi:hypothetical protein
MAFSIPRPSGETNHFLPVFIPQFQSDAGKTGHKGEGRFSLQRRNGMVALFQMVIGDSGT